MGTNINETIILKNLDLAEQDFLPYGMKYFMIDDGWQDHDDDWNSNKDRFPDHDGMEGMAWLEDLMHKVAVDWGYKWSKMDFSYYTLFATNLDNPDMTPSEAYHNALARIRQAIGPDTFLLLISATGLGFDLADGNRVTMDTEPWWGDDVGVFEPSFKSSYATFTRRYYLNHTDLGKSSGPAVLAR